MKTIVHVIDSLGRGGTETLLTDLLPSLSRHYKIVLVTLQPKNEFGDDSLKYCHKHYCLHYNGFGSLLSSVRRLRKIIRDHQPVLVRSQLVMSTIVSRLACPSQVPLVFSIHNTLSVLIKKNMAGQVIRMLERKIRSRNTTLIGVTRTIIKDYVDNFHYRGPCQTLYNYVRDDYFNTSGKIGNPGKTIRLVAVGNLRPQKNYPYLVEAFKKLKGTNVELDIYGDGEIRNDLQKQITEQELSIHLKGKVADIHKILGQYDAFVMVSSFEGFGIAVAEAMAAGMPLVLSDIAVFREITHGNAIFVDLQSPDSFVSAVQGPLHNQAALNTMVQVNRQIAQNDYSREGYLKKLLSIYAAVSPAADNSNPQ